MARLLRAPRGHRERHAKKEWSAKARNQMRGKVLPYMPACQPYWGKPAVRNDREGRGNVGIIRSPIRASILPDCGGRSVMSVPYRDPRREKERKFHESICGSIHKLAIRDFSGRRI